MPAAFNEEDFSKIVVGLYQSGRPKNGLPDYIDAVLNLESDMVKLEDRSQLSGYAWMPIADTPSARPSIKWLDSVAETIAGWRRMDWNVLVHCLAGVSRSTTATMAYLIKEYNLTVSRALDVVRYGRPKADPNVGFILSLEEYAASLNS